MYSWTRSTSNAAASATTAALERKAKTLAAGFEAERLVERATPLRVGDRVHRAQVASHEVILKCSHTNGRGPLLGPAHRIAYGVRETTNSDAGSVGSVFVKSDRNCPPAGVRPT